MQNRRVMLVCSRNLFGESIETLLRAEPDMELIGPWGVEEEICVRIKDTNPSAVVLVDNEAQAEEIASLTTAIMEANPKLPIIRAGLAEKVVRVYSTDILPARGADLLETIRNLPVVSEAVINPTKGAIKK